MLVNRNISTNNWDEINIISSDVMGVRLHGGFGTIDIVNVYNNCTNNNSLKVVERYMRGRGDKSRARNRLRGREGVVWLGDFNRHHPLWDEERNAHLFTKAALEATQPLLVMISNYDMHMVLAKDIPTLEACSTKNHTRVDNVFCSEELLDRFISCDTYLQWRPQKTDHMPIISIMDIKPERTTHVEKFNYKLTDWPTFNKTLENNLEDIHVVEELTSEEECLKQITKLDTAIKGAIKEHVPVIKLSPYMKRWWTRDLTIMKRQKKRLARGSYRRRAWDEDPIHGEFRQARNRYSMMIRRSIGWSGWRR